MTKAQEQSRMDRISACSKAVRQLLEEFWQESDLASDHLERAKSHLDEAWIDADGQNARTVDRLVADIHEARTLFHAVAAAAAGDKFDIGGRTARSARPGQARPENKGDAARPSLRRNVLRRG